MSSRLALALRCLALLAPAAVGVAATTFTPPPTPLASPEVIKALLATVPPPAPGEIVVDFEKPDIGTPIVKWEEQGVVFELAGPLQRTPGAKPRVTFFPHLATEHKGILNAMPNDQGVPLKMTFPGAGATSVTLVVWGSTNCPAEFTAYDKEGKEVDKKSYEAVPTRKDPSEPVPFLTLTLKGSAIASVQVSGPRVGEYVAVDEVRFLPVK